MRPSVKPKDKYPQTAHQAKVIHICQKPTGFATRDLPITGSLERIGNTSCTDWKQPIRLGRTEEALHMEIGRRYVGLMPSAWTLLGPENSCGMTGARRAMGAGRTDGDHGRDCFDFEEIAKSPPAK